ncbi:MAG: T9SS type A sorting domain-containing protein [Bacteroidales bacterium]|jgi:hypothetical protein|nr:T9SS type A sorting domain-containing protein [Bacteroidales bacterium]
MKRYKRFLFLTMPVQVWTQKLMSFLFAVLLLFSGFMMQEIKGEIHSNCFAYANNNDVNTVLDFCSGDSLVPPQPIQNPQNDDELFFNFRLQYFAPETEAFIKETFGDELKFEENSFWDYNSYNSHAVGFSTNLPVISIIEYGTTTAYGQTTEQSDSYYYNHLHYIKNLSSNTTYHYRILIQDYDGNLIYSEDSTFTTKTFTSDIIRIPDDINTIAPYTFTSNNTTYVLTQDLTVSTLAINVKAHNVEIDLNGHTIVYDDGTPQVVGTSPNDYDYDEQATFGIRGGLWNITNIKIFNGTIKQGANGGKGIVGAGFNPIYMGPMEDYIACEHEIAGVTVDYYGESINGIRAGRGKFHHNVIIDRGTVIDDRHLGIKALSTENDPNTEVSYNSIRRFRHQGIMGSAYKHHNELYSDSYATNSFLIGVRDSNRVEYNKMFGMGFNPVGTSWASNTVVNNNFIYLQGTAPNQRSNEYERLSGIAGLRYTLYGGTTYKNSVYEDNVVITKAWAGCSVARGIWTATGKENEGIYYRRNIVKMELLSYDSINFDMVELSLGAVEINGDNIEIDGQLPVPAIFEDNTLIGNVNLIVFGSGYGSAGSNGHFYRTKLEKLNHHDSYFDPVRIGYCPFNAHNNKLIDTELGAGVSIDPPKFHHLSCLKGYLEISYGISHEITVIDSFDNQPLKNTDIKINLNEGERTWTAKTDYEGKLKFDLLTVQHTNKNGVSARTEYTLYGFQIDTFPPYNISTVQLMDMNTIYVKAPPKLSNVHIKKLDDIIFCYPNPAHEYFHIYGLEGGETVQIFDITGRRLFVCEVKGEKEIIPVNTLSQGMYFVRITKDNKEVVTKKILVNCRQ